MKSNVCTINHGNKDLAAILRESEKVAVYNELNQKQAMQLRLLCEEIDGLLPEIIDQFEGDLWIEFEEGVCKVNVSIAFDDFTADKKAELVDLAKNKKNAAEVGVLGKIRSAIENFFLDEDVMQAYALSAGAHHTMTGYLDHAYVWSLEQYRTTIQPQERKEAWDELEKSVIASVADDVIVGVKGNRADITIVKRFG